MKSPFTLPTGSYTLTFQGLNPNGGNNIALIDSVALNTALVANGSFESPSVTDYQANPSDTAWSYTSDSGIAHDGGTYTSNNPNAPAGTQVAFVKNNGLLTQIWSAAAGTYTLSFQAAQRGSGNDSAQQLRVTLRPSGSAISTKTLLWCGNQICEERDSTGANVRKRFFAEGEQWKEDGFTNYYYSRDHLGSIREVTDANGVVRGRYDYDAWGNVITTESKSVLMVDFGYTGHYFHQPSGLNFTRTREYNPGLARWMNRDPIGEIGGTNLYEYVKNNPPNMIDPLGLIWYEDLASWSRAKADNYQRWLDFHLPWQVAGIGDFALELLALYASTPEAISHLGEGTGTWYEDPCWETSPGLFGDISLTAGIFAGGLKPTGIGNSAVGWKGGEVIFTRSGAATPDLRVNPFGGSGYPPHYHRRPGIKKHRPWEGGL